MKWNMFHLFLFIYWGERTIFKTKQEIIFMLENLKICVRIKQLEITWCIKCCLYRYNNLNFEEVGKCLYHVNINVLNVFNHLEYICIVKSSDKMIIDDQNLRNWSRLGPDFPSGSLGNMTSSFMKLNWSNLLYQIKLLVKKVANINKT